MTREQRVLHVLFTDPGFLPPLLRGARLQVEDGWKVQIVGARARDTPESEIPEWLRGRVRLLGGTHLHTVLRYVLFAVLVFFQALRHRPQLLYLSDPLSTPVGVVGILWPGIKVIYHEHDAPRPGERTLRGRFVASCRRFVAGRAVACVVPSRGRLGLLPPARRFDHDRLIVNNLPLRVEARVRHAGNQGKLRVVYMGSINANRLPLSVLEAVASVPQTRLWVVGYETVGHRGYSREVLNRARMLGIEDRVEIKGFFPFQDLPDVIRQCDVGLSLIPLATSDVNERTMIGASNKPFQFLACEVPLLVPDAKGWREAFAQRGVARTCIPGRPKTVGEALRWFVEHPGRAREMGRRGRELVLKAWNYETEFEAVLRLLDGRGTGTEGGRDLETSPRSQEVGSR